jgi:DNA-binding XRE family transcriptional regulator
MTPRLNRGLNRNRGSIIEFPLMPTGRRANEIDRQIGIWIRKHRIIKDLNQKELGRKVGVKFQQIQKYESGVSRASANMLFAIAVALDQPLAEHMAQAFACALPGSGKARQGTQAC